MLGKLIKHDFRSLSRVLFPTQLAVLGASIIATIGFAFNIRTGFYTSYESGGLQLLRVITAFLSGIMVLAIIAASILVAFIIFQRFYKNLMCDEGYLTFTLPVTTTQILWSKLITAMIWTFISGIVIFISVNIFVLFGTGTSGIVNTEAYRELSRLIGEAFSLLGGRLIWPILEVILFMIVATACNILHVYLALIMGGVASQKHKILAGIGFYFAINIAVTIVATIIQYFLSGAMFRTMDSFNGIPWDVKNAVEVFDLIFSSSQPYYWFYLLFSLAITAGFFILSRYFLKNKLNLE